MLQRSYFAKIIFVISLLLILIFLGSYLVHFIQQAVIGFSYPYATNFYEGEHLANAVRFFDFKNPYPKLNTYPYIALLYGPSYFIITAVMTTILGKTLLAGRLVTFISVLFISLFIYLIVKLKTRDQIVSIALSLLFFSSPILNEWGWQFRVDYFAIFLSLLGLYLFIRYEDSKRRNYSIIPFVLAAYCKTSYILAPIACTIYLLSRKRGRERLTVLSNYFGMFLLSWIFIFALLNLFTKGQFFIDTILVHSLYYRRPGSFQSGLFLSRWGIYFRQDYMIIIFSIIFGLYEIFRFRNVGLFVTYLFLALLRSISIGYTGADLNYILEPQAISFITLGLFFGRLRKIKTDLWLLNYVGNAIFIAFLVSICFTRPIKMFSRSFSQPLSLEVKDQINELVKITPDPIIIDSEVNYLVSNNKQVLYEPFAMNIMETAGLWDSSKSELIRDIQKKRFNLFIYAQRFTSYQIFKEFRENYLLVERKSCYDIYKPVEDDLHQEVKQLWQALSSMEFWQKYPFRPPLKRQVKENIILLGLSTPNMVEYEELTNRLLQMPNVIGIYRPISDKPDLITAVNTSDKVSLNCLFDTLQSEKVQTVFANSSLICTREYSNKGELILNFQPLFITEEYKKSYSAVEGLYKFQVWEESGTKKKSDYSFIHPLGDEKEGWIIYKVSSPLLIERVILETFPRIHHSNKGMLKVAVSYSTDGKNFSKVYEVRSKGGKEWSPIGVKEINTVTINDYAVYIKFVLFSENSQLWSSFQYPMILKVVTAKEK